MIETNWTFSSNRINKWFLLTTTNLYFSKFLFKVTNLFGWRASWLSGSFKMIRTTALIPVIRSVSLSYLLKVCCWADEVMWECLPSTVIQIILIASSIKFARNKRTRTHDLSKWWIFVGGKIVSNEKYWRM